MTGIYLLLGSNLGKKRETLEKASELLEQQIGPVVSKSSIYCTEAWGMDNVPLFLNQVLMVNSGLKPITVLRTILKIEMSLGRKRAIGYRNRSLDVDILYFGDQMVKHPDLTIPHPRIAERRFVLEPLVEIAPNFVHPVLSKTNSQLLALCSDPLMVKRLGTNE